MYRFDFGWSRIVFEIPCGILSRIIIRRSRSYQRMLQDFSGIPPGILSLIFIRISLEIPSEIHSRILSRILPGLLLALFLTKSI